MESRAWHENGYWWWGWRWLGNWSWLCGECNNSSVVCSLPLQISIAKLTLLSALYILYTVNILDFLLQYWWNQDFVPFFFRTSSLEFEIFIYFATHTVHVSSLLILSYKLIYMLMCHLQGDNSTSVLLWYIPIGPRICTCLKCLMKVVRKLHLPKIKCKITLCGLATVFRRKDISVQKRTFEIECILTIWSMWTIFSCTSYSVIQSLSCTHISFNIF